MLFVTVGTQLAFPRLLEAMDALAPSIDEEIVAQVGPDPTPRPNLDCRENVAPAEFEKLFTGARLIVAHAGIGTILSAKRYKKPLVLMPRRHALGEHRNDHQLATAEAVQALKGVYIAWQADDLPGLIAQGDLESADDSESATHTGLIERLKAFVETA